MEIYDLISDMKTSCQILFETISSDLHTGCRDLGYLRYIDSKVKKPSMNFCSIDRERDFSFTELIFGYEEIYALPSMSFSLHRRNLTARADLIRVYV